VNLPQLNSGARPPVLTVIGGVDPGGGAGVIRDLLTARALGARPIVVGTAWTVQGGDVDEHRVEPRAPKRLAQAIRHAVAQGTEVVKVGMVPDTAAVRAILDGLAEFDGPVVVDPVLESSRHLPLFLDIPTQILPLMRRATLATPNALEAAILTGRRVRDLAEAEAAGETLRAASIPALLVKGGHLGDTPEPITDLLITAGGVRRLVHPRLPGPTPRGTGCALATAIAVALARGATLDAAVDGATAWLARAIAAAVDVGGERQLDHP
jgi:hydroxymethylpyrimidine/phosphomethylpyrimidine kinase